VLILHRITQHYVIRKIANNISGGYLIEEGEEKGAHEKRDGIIRPTAKSESMGANGP